MRDGIKKVKYKYEHLIRIIRKFVSTFMHNRVQAWTVWVPQTLNLTSRCLFCSWRTAGQRHWHSVSVPCNKWTPPLKIHMRSYLNIGHIVPAASHFLETFLQATKVAASIFRLHMRWGLLVCLQKHLWPPNLSAEKTFPAVLFLNLSYSVPPTLPLLFILSLFLSLSSVIRLVWQLY